VNRPKIIERIGCERLKQSAGSISVWSTVMVPFNGYIFEPANVQFRWTKRNPALIWNPNEKRTCISKEILIENIFVDMSEEEEEEEN